MQKESEQRKCTFQDFFILHISLITMSVSQAEDNHHERQLSKHFAFR